MGKHYRDFTVGELIDMGFDVQLYHYGALHDGTREEALNLINQFYHDGDLERSTRQMLSDIVPSGEYFIESLTGVEAGSNFYASTTYPKVDGNES